MKWLRIFGFRQRPALEARMREEMDFHIEQATTENIRAGMPPEEARRRALVSFGGRDNWSEATRDEIRSRPLEEFAQDVRYALRSLRRVPGLTLAAIATLAISIGATTSIFSVVNSLLLKALPYPDADRIVAVCERSTTQPTSSPCPIGGFSGSNFIVWREQARSFAAMAAFAEGRRAITEPGREPVSAQVRFANASIFTVLGARPELGRLLTEADDQPGTPNLVVLSHGFWREHWSGDSSVVGRQIRINGNDATVIGVLPAGFGLYDPVDAWLPIRFSAQQRTAPGRYLRVVGLLNRGVHLDEANREMALLAARRAQDVPQYNTGMTAFVLSLREKLLGNTDRVLWTLLGAVGFLLLIACANVANLLLARAAARQRELAVRVSMGASPGRLIRQLLTESVVLSVVSAVIGLALALKGTQLLVALVPEGMSTQSLTGIVVDWRLLTFAAVIAIGTGLLFGVIPALHGARGDVHETLKGGGRGSGASRASARLRSALVVAEMSLALVLLAGAGLMVRSFAALQHVSLGFDPDQTLTARLSLPGRKYPNDTVRIETFHQVEAQLAAIPGVQAVGAISYLPLTGERSVNGFTVEGRPTPKPGEEPAGDMRAVTPGYFAAMGIPIKEGRGFTDDDGMGRSSVGIVSETLARKLFPGESAVGHILLYEWSAPERVLIVGVAGDVHHDGPDKETYMEVYRPFAQFVYPGMNIVLRVAADPMSFARSAAAAVRSVDRDLPLASVQPMSALVSKSVGRAQLSTTLFGMFGVIGLILAAIGIYGVMSYTVEQRRREFGIRVALGATPRRLVAMVTGRGALLSLIGIVIGTGAAFAAAGLMRNLLFGVPPHDVVTFVTIALVLAGVGVLAAFIPGLRATRVNPVAALREERRPDRS
jgi:putative ABC transport system permease protein